ncbi:hypothetical protein [Sphingomonas sp. 3-13AW]|jgi:predicted flap endonuclease-1-like 5' DNA nuclease|uniref:hypothetical protein n=1 Tax=Sphingomonas sp. 3-13AW TaxID=3050450 RepID=UPI003BB8159C
MEEVERSSETVVGAAEQMMPYTITTLVCIAIFAVIVIAAILWGMRMRRRSRACDREIQEQNRAHRARPDAPVADPDAPGQAIAADRRVPVEPTDLPAPVPPIVQEPQQAPAAQPAPVAPSAAPPVPTAPAASEPVAAPQPTPTPAVPMAAATDLTTLKGLGPKVAAQLAELGVTSIADLAALSPAEAEQIDASLGTFQGRMARDRWVEQAQLLAAGDRAAYEAKFGKLG